MLRLAAVALVLNASLVLGALALVGIDERAHPPIGTFVTVDGRRLHLVQAAPLVPLAGQDRATVPPLPTLLLLHGGGTSLLDLSTSLLPALTARGYPVIAIDRPGHGYSEARRGDASPPRQARLIQGALDELGIDETVWIGHSRGAAVVLAALLAERPMAGVLLAGVTQPAIASDPTFRRLLQTPLVGPWFAWTAIEYAGRGAMPAVLDSAFAPETPPTDYIERTGLRLSLRPMTALHDARERVAVNRWLQQAVERYARIDRPVIAVHGEEDVPVPAGRHLLPLMDLVPSLSILTLPGAGHGIVHTRTDEVADAIVRELAERS